MAERDAVATTQEVLGLLEKAVAMLRDQYGDTLGVRRVSSDVSRLATDLDELGPPAPGHRPGPSPDDLEEIPDTPYDEAMWSDAEHEGFGAPDRRAP